MTELKKGQHYDEDNVRRAGALIASIRRHLDEERCNHSLQEIVEDGLR